MSMISGGAAVGTVPGAPTDDRRGRVSGPDLRFAAVLVVAMAVLGALLGLVWAAWSPPGPRALVVSSGVFIPDETESFVAGDGRYLLLTAIVGLLAALGVWFVVRRRGPLVALALAAGGAAGAALTELVGHLTGGGSFDGARNTVVAQLPLSLHAHGLLLIEAAVALLVYGLLVAFAAHDDLGHEDPVRARLSPPAPEADPAGPVAGSVLSGDHPQYGGRHGDAPGPLQQGDLPPQQP